MIPLGNGRGPERINIFGGIMSLHDFNTMLPEEVTATYLRKAALGENLTVARVEVKAGEITQLHEHAGEEVILVLSGAWRFYLQGSETTLTANQMLCIPAGVEHSSEVLEDTVAIDICAAPRWDWMSGADRVLHQDPNQFLWAV